MYKLLANAPKMNKAHARTQEIKWWYDPDIFKEGFKDFILLTDYMIDSYPIAGLNKDRNLPYGLLGMGWNVYIMHSGKEIVSFQFTDEYWIHFDDRNNEDEIIEMVLTDTIQKLREHYNNRKEEIGIQSSLPDISNDDRQLALKQLKEHLELKWSESGRPKR
jgi:hypothetical protein